jgi:hypothetical protein
MASIAILGLAVLAPSFALAQVPSAARSILADVLLWLPGQYSNAAQIESDLQQPAGRAPNTVPLAYREYQLTNSGATQNSLRFTVLSRLGRKDGSIESSEPTEYTIAYDATRRVVVMRAIWSPTRAARDNCLWLWERYGAQLRARCERANKKNTERVHEWLLGADSLWLVNSMHTAKFMKLREFECLFGHRVAGAEPEVLNGPHMHDGGDVYRWTPKSAPARRLYFDLLRGRGLAEAGDADVELLRIRLFEGDPDGDIKANKLLGVGFASTASDRASFNSREFNGRCKLFDPTAPPPK